MKKKFFNSLIILLLVILLYELITNSYLVKESIVFSFDLWKNNIFPYLFPFFIISDLLININIIDLINKHFNKLMYRIFKISSEGSFVFFMSILSGIPSNAKYIDSLLKTNKLSKEESAKILLFTHFVSPLFIIGYIGNIVGKNNSILILCIHYTTNIILGLIFRNYHVNKSDVVNTIHSKRTNNSFIKTITSSILNSINTLLLILGVISFFAFLTTCINLYIPSPIVKSIISGLFEITNGINNISILDISIKSKMLLIVAIISFGGFSSHIQVMAILEEYKMRYFPYLISRILHSIISILIMMLLI